MGIQRFDPSEWATYLKKNSQIRANSPSLQSNFSKNQGACAFERAEPSETIGKGKQRCHGKIYKQTPQISAICVAATKGGGK